MSDPLPTMSDLEVKLITRKMLNIEDPDEFVDPTINHSVYALSRSAPGNLNISLETFAGPNRLGQVICMEKECWSEMYLEEEEAFADGGKSRGLGGWEVYLKHCQLPEHVEERDKRLARERKMAEHLARKKAALKASGSIEVDESPSKRGYKTMSKAMLQKSNSQKEALGEGSSSCTAKTEIKPPTIIDLVMNSPERKHSVQSRTVSKKRGHTLDSSDSEDLCPPSKKELNKSNSRNDPIVLSETDEDEMDIKPKNKGKERAVDVKPKTTKPIDRARSNTSIISDHRPSSSTSIRTDAPGRSHFTQSTKALTQSRASIPNLKVDTSLFKPLGDALERSPEIVFLQEKAIGPKKIDVQPQTGQPTGSEAQLQPRPNSKADAEKDLSTDRTLISLARKTVITYHEDEQRHQARRAEETLYSRRLAVGQVLPRTATEREAAARRDAAEIPKLVEQQILASAVQQVNQLTFEYSPTLALPPLGKPQDRAILLNSIETARQLLDRRRRLTNWTDTATPFSRQYLGEIVRLLSAQSIIMQTGLDAMQPLGLPGNIGNRPAGGEWASVDHIMEWFAPSSKALSTQSATPATEPLKGAALYQGTSQLSALAASGSNSYNAFTSSSNPANVYAGFNNPANAVASSSRPYNAFAIPSSALASPIHFPNVAAATASFPDHSFRMPGSWDAQPQSDTTQIADQDMPAAERQLAMATEQEELALARLGPVELQSYFQESLADFSENATVTGGCESLGLSGVNDRIPGMRITLLPHQIIGVAWLIKKELGSDKGGILADAMGLGKTIQMIATMVKNPPERKSEDKRRSTLIVAPVSLLSQWKKEIEEKTDLNYSILIYHGAHKVDRKALQRYDVVLTSFGTMVSELPDSVRPQNKKSKPKFKHSSMDGFVIDDESSEDGNMKEKKAGPLFTHKWYRAILDESAIIRNRKTLAAIAAFELDATYRWSVTGTLVTNSLDDLFSHFHFIGLRNFADWDYFRGYISEIQKRKPGLAGKRAQAVLKRLCLRRTKDSMIGGMPLLQLPVKDVIIHRLHLDHDEQSIYDSVQAQAQIRFNKFMKAGTIAKNYHVVLVMILRLKQLTCHPSLLVRKPGEAPNDHDLMIDTGVGAGSSQALVQAQSSGSPEAERERARTIGGDELVAKLEKALSQRFLEFEKKGDTDIMDCPICQDGFFEDVITTCGHLFCRPCIQDYLTNSVQQPLEEAEIARLDRQNVRPCPMCRQDVSGDKLFNAAAFEPEEEEEEEDDVDIDLKPTIDLAGAAQYLTGVAKKDVKEEVHARPKYNGTIKKLSKAQGKLPFFKDEKLEEDELSDEVEEITLMPSSKLQKMTELLEGFLSANNEDKILIFSQFTGFIDIISDHLSSKGINHVLYTGQMTRSHKEDTIDFFKAKPDLRVMVLSLKSGNVGLNLTVANKVICMDLAWNYAVEAQAQDRVHRIGQTKPVDIHRLTTVGTIEEKIMDLQEKKKALADGAFGEGGAARQRMTIEDLTRLFSFNAPDE